MTRKEMVISKEVALYGLYRLSKACKGTVTGFTSFAWTIANGNRFIHKAIESDNYMFLATNYPTVGYQESLIIKLDDYGCVEGGYYHHHHCLPNTTPEWETLIF